MRSLLRAFAVVALLAAPAVAVGGCSALQHLSESTPGQATTVAAAEQLYTTATRIEIAWLKSGKATPAQAKVAKALEGAAYADIVAAREAVAANDSPAVAVSLKLFNQALPAFRDFLTANGGAHE